MVITTADCGYLATVSFLILYVKRKNRTCGTVLSSSSVGCSTGGSTGSPTVLNLPHVKLRNIEEPQHFKLFLTYFNVLYSHATNLRSSYNH